MAVTRLGPSALPMELYGSFAGRTAEVIVAAPTLVRLASLVGSAPKIGTLEGSAPGIGTVAGSAPKIGNLDGEAP